MDFFPGHSNDILPHTADKQVPDTLPDPDVEEDERDSDKE
jgi:hypothetical protein